MSLGIALRRKNAGSSAVVSDSFNRADSALTLGNADTGQAWTDLAGTWGISSNQAYCASPVPESYTVIDSGITNCTVALTLTGYGAGAYCGMAVRVTDLSNLYLVQLQSTALGLYKRVAGAYTSLGSGVVAGNLALIECVLSGTSITVKIDGATLIAITDATYTTQTKHGLRTGVSAPRFDNFSVAA